MSQLFARRSGSFACVLIASLFLTSAQAQDNSSVPATDQATTTTKTIPAGTKVFFKLDAILTSKTAQPNDKFELTVASDVTSGTDILIPAGSKATGEVIHAQKARGLGKAGELLVTIRHIHLNGQSIKMRAFQPFQGRNNSNTAFALSQAIGPFAGFIKGGEIEMPAGTSVQASVAADTLISVSNPVAPVITVTEDNTQNQVNPSIPEREN